MQSVTRLMPPTLLRAATSPRRAATSRLSAATSACWAATVVCLFDLCEGEACSHNYHEACINPWLERSPLCPTCKQSQEVGGESRPLSLPQH
mmetsp:Transcript_25318/g.80115  ORF Transcript_25318/g.80115 Transcript_25318/m.80115 type:complete len:92 (+) Transcript_25318:493-768(+)